ncbi:MAG: AmmeMemoRadiSam system radical SAM enzyme [candidate division Zixibacteria bacterium]|nr:AmmeMemoRadiSam system radical SAM enzyme [candidate division Zixibacteria bacterium]
MHRRQFIMTTAIGGGLALCPKIALVRADEMSSDNPALSKYHYPAQFYEKLGNGIVECRLCPRKCIVSDLERGYCGVRENIGGEYYTLVHSRVCSSNIDPIEKKPFFHFLPGTNAFSIATAGCNMNCKFCQNWTISQFRPEDVNHIAMTPDDCARVANDNNCPSIAYTYSEPTIFFEYMFDCAIAAKSRDIRSTVVTAGYIEKDPLLELIGLVDAIKIDLKAFTESYYKEICNSALQPVLDTLVTIKKSGTWLEIVYLMLPGLNDDESEISDLCDWLLDNLGPDVPIHFTRFHPSYLLQNLTMTPLVSLERAHSVAREKGLHYCYIGNVYGHDTENTYCHHCGKLLIGRRGFQITANKLDGGKCPSCQTTIPGVWD